MTGHDRPNRFGRRTMLAGMLGGAAAGLTSACVPPVGPSVGASSPHVYIGLGRKRELAILDAISDRVVERISLHALGERGFPWELTVGPNGHAALLPMSAGAKIGFVTRTARQQALPLALSSMAPTIPTETPGAKNSATEHGVQCSWINVASTRLGTGLSGAGEAETASGRVLTKVSTGEAGSNDRQQTFLGEQTVKTITSDTRGRAYVLVAAPLAWAGNYVAVVDLSVGKVLRHLRVSEPGESVLALQASPDGARLYVSTWRWPDPRSSDDRMGAPGQILAINTRTGQTVARAALPDQTAAVEFALAMPPAGSRLVGDPSALALYVVTSTPGPRKEESFTPIYGRKSTLTALDGDHLESIAFWTLENKPSGIVVTPNGHRAYLLHGSVSWAPWSRRLTSLDLASGNVSQEWPMPPGCFNITHSPIGKLYITDTLDDRLWRVNTASDMFLGSIPLAGAPVAVAARPL